MDKYDQAHEPANLAGPDDARPSALQIIQDEDLVNKMPDKVFVVTGVSSGIGIETGRALAATGAKVFMTVRDVAKGEAACKDYLEPGRVELVTMDNTSLASVRTAAATILSKSDNKVNGLICNAGIMACPYARSTDGFESQFATNHLAHFLLFSLLRDALLAASTPTFNSRVVMVASSGHMAGDIRPDDYGFSEGKDYEPWKAYGQSKSANIYMANEIENKYAAKGLHGFSLNPGGIWSGLQKHFPADFLAEKKSDPNVTKMMKSPAQGAATSVRAAVAAAFEGKGRLYLEDCNVARLNRGGDDGNGYIPRIYDADKERRLWEDSEKMVGLTS